MGFADLLSAMVLLKTDLSILTGILSLGYRKMIFTAQKNQPAKPPAPKNPNDWQSACC
jgi:hypothetical protein